MLLGRSTSDGGSGLLLHPGDAYDVAPSGVDVLALPLWAPWSKTWEMVDYLRAVSPPVAVPVHEGPLQPPARAIYLGHATNLAPERTRIVDLAGARRHRPPRLTRPAPAPSGKFPGICTPERPQAYKFRGFCRGRARSGGEGGAGEALVGLDVGGARALDDLVGQRRAAATSPERSQPDAGEVSQSRTTCLSNDGCDPPGAQRSSGQNREESGVSTSSPRTTAPASSRPNSSLVSASTMPRSRAMPSARA